MTKDLEACQNAVLEIIAKRDLKNFHNMVEKLKKLDVDAVAQLILFAITQSKQQGKVEFKKAVSRLSTETLTN